MPKPQASTVQLNRVSPEVATISFANPPVNLIVLETVAQLHQLVVRLEQDKDIKVVLFQNDNPDFFYNHFDVSQASAFIGKGNEGGSIWTDLVLRLSKAPFISVAKIRGRTRGGGNELALALDLRYASREKAFFGQPEVGSGILPGGGGSERLPRQIGRDRALEAILTSMDYDADTAERWGWVTRALPDKELDAFVDDLVKRLASFDKTALMAAKRQINRATLPPDEDLHAAYAEFEASLSFPGFNPRSAKLAKLLTDLGVRDIEKRLGHYLGLANKFS